MTAEERVIEAALDLLWSQWAELGVPGLRSSSHDVVVSPVDLVLFTPGILEDRDARLAGLVQAWCARHGARTFGSRELGVRRAALPEPARRVFDSWTAVLREASGGPWPVPEQPLRGGGPPISDRDVPFRSDRRPAVHLRARSLFGIGVRADLVCALLKADAEKRALASPDVAHLGHSPRAVQLALAALEDAGVALAQKQGRTHSYTLARPRALADVLDAGGLTWFPWHHALPVTFHLVAFAAHSSADARVRHVRAHAIAGLLERHTHALHGLPQVPIRPGDDEAAERLMVWGAEAIAAFMRGGR